MDLARDERERTTNLGLIGATFGIGFMVGLFLGSILSKVSQAFPLWFTGGLALANATMAYFFLPESLRARNPKRRLGLAPETHG